MKRSRVQSLLIMVAIVLGVAFALRTCDDAPFAFESEHLDLGPMRADLRSDSARLLLSIKGQRKRFPLTLRLHEGAAFVPLPLGHATRVADGVQVPVHLSSDPKTRSGTLTLKPGGAPGVLRVELTIEDPAVLSREPSLAVEVSLDEKTRSVFVSEVGELADLGEASGPMLVVGEDPLALGVASEEAKIGVTLLPEPTAHVGAPKTAHAFAPKAKGEKKSTLFLALSRQTQSLYGPLWAALGTKTFKVHGVVGGAGAGTRLYGIGEDGSTRLRAIVGERGRFEVDVPKDVNRWYAAVDESRTSPPLFFEPGADWDLRLDVSAGGELTARVHDADGDAPLVARIAVRGIDGTLDPSFGPDYRASGAGPLVDSRTGEVTTPLPAGHYRVSATKGIEWSIDSKNVVVEPGGRGVVDLRLRHVVATPGEIGCDLHVHARPSFDSPVLPEDRVLSLVAAGVEFAVPTEHNLVGDYGPSLEALDLGRALAWVPGVEVTTYTPRFGHFGVFPMQLDAAIPPYRRTTAGAIFQAAHRDPGRIVQVHHPRLPKDIGYFEVSGFDPKEPKTLSRIRLDFDALEVYNGFDVQHPSRVDAVLEDWYALLETGRRYVATGSSDAHRIQYNWAGYPRTMVRVGDDTMPVDPRRVVESLKKGQATVTSGPIVELEVRLDRASGEPIRPGGELELHGKHATANVRVQAAPWIDVTEVVLVANGQVAAHADVPSRPTVTGPEPGSIEEARARALRYEGSFPVPEGARWIVVLARGKRSMDDALAFMPVVPLGFTNPVWFKP